MPRPPVADVEDRRLLLIVAGERLADDLDAPADASVDVARQELGQDGRERVGEPCRQARRGQQREARRPPAECRVAPDLRR